MKKNLVKEEPKLSKKQQELVQAQLQKEATIRGNLKQVHLLLTDGSTTIIIIIFYSENAASFHSKLETDG